MYCQNCGNELREALSFCNRCGARVSSELEKIENPLLPAVKAKLVENLSYAVISVSFAGVVGLAILIGNILRRDIVPHQAIAFIMIFGVVLIAIVGLIMYVIGKLIASPLLLSTNGNGKVDKQKNDAKQNSLLEPAKYVPISVVENTTRTLEGLPIDKQ